MPEFTPQDLNPDASVVDQVLPVGALEDDAELLELTESAQIEALRRMLERTVYTAEAHVFTQLALRVDQTHVAGQVSAVGLIEWAKWRAQKALDIAHVTIDDEIVDHAIRQLEKMDFSKLFSGEAPS